MCQFVVQGFIPAAPTPVPTRQVANGARFVPLRKGNVTIRAGSRTSLAGSWTMATSGDLSENQKVNSY